MQKTIKICHLTTVHPRHDIRIFYKEATSLASEPNNSVTLLVADNLPPEVRNKVKIQSIGKSKNRLYRLLYGGLRILKTALKEKCDIYHIHDPELYWLVVPLRIKGKSVILDLHEDLPSQLLSKPYLNKFLKYFFHYLAKGYEGFLFRFATHLITATPYIRDINIRKNKNITCVSNYPISTEFRPTEDIDISNQQPQEVCYTGAITSIRGVGYLIDVVLKYSDDWILNLAGPIGDEEIKRKLETALQKTNRIKYWGNVERNTLKDIFSRSSIGFVPFLNVPNHINAVPNKLFEYMSSGIPIICSNFEYWSRVINESETGELIDPTDINGIANTIRNLLERPALMNEYGRNGLLAVKNMYNWENESLKLINIYNEIIK